MLGEIAQGKSNAAVAKSLFLSVRAVEKHINSLFSKLGPQRGTGRPPPRQGGAAVPVRRRARGLAPPPVRLLAPWSAEPCGVRRWSQMTEANSHSPNGEVPVLIVDDQAPFVPSRAPSSALAPGFSVVAEAESGEQALDLAGEHHPGLVLMDINLPGINGIEASRRILTADPETTVILLSTYTQDDLPADARTCGAAAYVHKEDMSPALLRRIWDERAVS